MKHTLIIHGPHCKSCVMLITDALTDLGVTNIKLTLDEKAKKASLVCDYAGKKEDIIATIKKEGYTV
jgi:copper chaperone CopZ